jgi:hypothetical protein
MLDGLCIKGTVLDRFSNGSEGLQVKLMTREEVFENAHRALVFFFGNMVIRSFPSWGSNSTHSACARTVTTWSRDLRLSACVIAGTILLPVGKEPYQDQYTRGDG